MIAALIMLFIYALVLVWAGFMAYKHWDKLSMFSPWHWICGSSRSSDVVKFVLLLVVIVGGSMVAGYMDSLGGAL